jgi:hypothetical protein
VRPSLTSWNLDDVEGSENIIGQLIRRAVVLTLLFPAIAGCATYYVSPRGSDSNAGTKASPWRSVSRVTTIRFAAGDQLLLEGGESFAGNLVLDERCVTNPAHPIVIGSYGEGRATIQAGEGTGILVKNIGGVTIRDLRLVSESADTNRGFGVEVVNQRGLARLDSIRIENVEATGFHWAGIYVGGRPMLPVKEESPVDHAARFGFEHVTIARSVASGNMYYGIWVSGPWGGQTGDYANGDVAIRQCNAHHNPGDPSYKENHSGNGILLDDTDGGLIEHCTAYANGAANGSQQGGPVGIWADESNRITIQSCESYRNRTGGAADGGGFDLDGGVTNSVMQYNYSHGNDGAGFLMWSYWGAIHPLSNNVIRYNISENDGRKHAYGGVHIGTSRGTVQNINVYNNNIFMTAAQAASNARGSEEPVKPKVVWVGGIERNHGVRFRNNLFIADAGVPLVEIEPHQDAIFQGNAYWARTGRFIVLDAGASFGTLQAWRAATGQEELRSQATGLSGDPRLSAAGEAEAMAGKSLESLRAYRLLPGSPLTDAGLDLHAEFGLDTGKHDFWGTPIPQGNGFDIGACEARAPAN